MRRRVPAFSGWFILLAMTFIVHDAEFIITKGSHPQFWNKYISITYGLRISEVHLRIRISKADFYDVWHSATSSRSL